MTIININSISDIYDVQPLAHGALADIYRALYGATRQPAILKIPRGQPALDLPTPTRLFWQDTGSISESEPDPIDALRNEIATYKKLDSNSRYINMLHAGEITSSDENNSVPYLVLEYRQGETLREVINKKSDFNLTMLSDLAIDLEKMAQKGLPNHGDIKPDNILVTGSEVRLFDPASGSVRMQYGLMQNYLLTPAYAPFLTPDDAVALAITAVEVAIGIQPLALPDLAERPEHDVSDELADKLMLLIQMGRGQLVHFLPQVPLPTELKRSLSSDWDDFFLAALNMVRIGKTLSYQEKKITLQDVADFLDSAQY
ncbi:MAG: hypothetical protein JW841_12505 [Deltaproteobacteria bacterium]|nr:hypothetical protein [Deltaproteobacteria bacterium]